MRTLLSAVILLLLPVAAWAAECGCGYPTRCAVPCERCRPRHVCVQVPVPQPQPCEHPEPMYERGGYAAPPRMGTAAGESETTGFTGGGIQFPALHLRLPTIQLPGIVRFRRDAHLLLDQAEGAVRNGPTPRILFRCGTRDRRHARAGSGATAGRQKRSAHSAATVPSSPCSKLCRRGNPKTPPVRANAATASEGAGGQVPRLRVRHMSLTAGAAACDARAHAATSGAAWRPIPAACHGANIPSG